MDPYPRGSDWMPITTKTGSLFHADLHRSRPFREIDAFIARTGMSAPEEPLAVFEARSVLATSPLHCMIEPATKLSREHDDQRERQAPNSVCYVFSRNL